jgi:hypothetical protein
VNGRPPGPPSEPPESAVDPTVDLGRIGLTPGKGGFPTEVRLEDGRTVYRQPDGTYTFTPEPPPAPPTEPPPASQPEPPPPAPPPAPPSDPPASVEHTAPFPVARPASLPFRGLLPTLATLATVGIVAVALGLSTRGGDGDEEQVSGWSPATTATTSPAATATTEPVSGDGATQAVAIIRSVIEDCYAEAGNPASEVAPGNLEYQATTASADAIGLGPGEFFIVRIAQISPPHHYVDWWVNLATGHVAMALPRSEHRSDFGTLFDLDWYAFSNNCQGPHLSPFIDGDDPFP